MGVSQKFIENLPREAILAENEIINEFQSILNLSSVTKNKNEFYNEFFDIFSFYRAFAEANNMSINFPKLGIDKKNNIGLIISFFTDRQKIVEKLERDYSSQKSQQDTKQKYLSLLDNKFAYEFSDDEYMKIREQLGELIAIMNFGNDFTDEFKERQLKSLKELQENCQKKVTNINQFWQLVGIAGLTVGLVGSKAKPYIERIRDIINIIWQVQARSEGLSDTTPLMFLRFQEHFKA